MSHQESNFEEPEEELGENLKVFSLPRGLKCAVTITSVTILIFIVTYTSKYLASPMEYASPNELSLSSLFLFSISGLLLVWIPWDKLGIRISKIGGVEFTEVVEMQASEHAEDLSYLEDRIEYLESYIRDRDDAAKLGFYFQEPELRDLLVSFLTKYKKWAFSPSRIKAWGSKQQGFSKLSSFDHHTLRSTMQKMVSENILETRISKKGNTLYRIPVA